MGKRADITPELCRQLLRYEPETGKLFWLRRTPDQHPHNASRALWNGQFADKEALTFINHNGYYSGNVKSVGFLAHRVAWAIYYGEWPIFGLDHINGNKTDNRIANLREADHRENGKNTKLTSRSRFGVLGVGFVDRVGRWKAFINDENGLKHLGYFSTFHDAVAARKDAERRLGYHPNHSRHA